MAEGTTAGTEQKSGNYKTVAKCRPVLVQGLNATKTAICLSCTIFSTKGDTNTTVKSFFFLKMCVQRGEGPSNIHEGSEMTKLPANRLLFC